MLNYYLFAILLLYVFNNIVNKIIYSKVLEEFCVIRVAILKLKERKDDSVDDSIDQDAL